MTKKSIDIKRIILLPAMLMTLTVAGQNVSGQVVDARGEGIPYINVVALSLPDSAYITGVMTDSVGRFGFDVPPEGRLLRVSGVGYKTVYVDRTENEGRIFLQEDTRMLGEVVVRSRMPKTRLKGDAMVTNIVGTVLETAGSMENLLDRIPNVSANSDKIEVFGRGEPEIYINGRKMLDKVELERLSSDNIKSVEVVTNPGARYGASVKSVIRITTKKAVGEGFGFDNKLFGELNDRNYVSGQERINMNWRSGGLDIGGTFNISRTNTPDPKQMEQITYLDKTWRQPSSIDQVYKDRNLYGRLALSYMFNENHSLGASLSWYRLPWNNASGYMKSSVVKDDLLTEELLSSYVASGQTTTLQGNLYYVGKIGRLGIDFNTDWYWNKMGNVMTTVEDYQETEQEPINRQVITSSDSRNNLVASKLVLTSPLFGGTLSFGGEYSYSVRNTLYSVLPTDLLEDDKSRIEEGMASAFVEYVRHFGPLSMQAGLRYENVDFDYYDNGVYIGEQSRVFNNVFPSLSLSGTFGDFSVQLGYASDIYRPSYSQLRSNITYDNRYTYEGGNPFLLPSRSNNVNLSLTYKWIMFNAGWSHVVDPILQNSEPYGDDPSVVLFRPVNGESYDKMYASLNISPSFGVWHPSLMFGVQKQWFAMQVHGHNPLNNPVGTFRFDNTLDTKICRVSLNMRYTTRGGDENIYMMKPSFRADLSLYKAFMQDRLTVQLLVKDLFKTSRRRMTLFYGSMRETFWGTPAQRKISLTVRYKFNVGKSKYKGTGAGQSQKSRM